MPEPLTRPEKCPSGHVLPTVEQQRTLYTPCSCPNGVPHGTHRLGHWTITCPECSNIIQWYDPPHNGQTWVTRSDFGRINVDSGQSVTNGMRRPGISR